MKLSAYLRSLREFFEEHGDMEIYYAADDEGNDYQKVVYYGTKMYLLDQDKEAYRPDLYSGEDIEEYEDDEFIPVCVIN
jgi:hypothetical protein